VKYSSIIFSLALVWSLAACTDSGGSEDGTPATTTEAETGASDASDASDGSDGSDASDAADSSDATDSSDTTDQSDATDASDASATTDDDPSDTSTVTTVDDIRGLDLVGNVPRVTTELPAFTATNSDGEARGPPNLEGNPTVLWFFPAAGTYG